jgi:hypothetical protein
MEMSSGTGGLAIAAEFSEGNKDDVRGQTVLDIFIYFTCFTSELYAYIQR